MSAAPAAAPGCVLGCCIPEIAALRDGGWSDDGTKIDPRRREHLRREWAATSARLDRRHADYPKCRLCGQRAMFLDAAGLCSKVKGEHEAYRARLGVSATPAAKGRRR